MVVLAYAFRYKEQKNVINYKEQLFHTLYYSHVNKKNTIFLYLNISGYSGILNIRSIVLYQNSTKL